MKKHKLHTHIKTQGTLHSTLVEPSAGAQGAGAVFLSLRLWRYLNHRPSLQTCPRCPKAPERRMLEDRTLVGPLAYYCAKGLDRDRVLVAVFRIVTMKDIDTVKSPISVTFASKEVFSLQFT